MSLNEENEVCSCSGVTVGDIQEELKNMSFREMTLEDKLVELDIGQTCECCLEKDCDIIDTHYSEVLGEELEED